MHLAVDGLVLQVYANDLNPKSYQYLEENIRLNKVRWKFCMKNRRFQLSCLLLLRVSQRQQVIQASFPDLQNPRVHALADSKGSRYKSIKICRFTGSCMPS